MATTTFEYELGSLEYFQMNQKIDLAMMDVLWKTQAHIAAKAASSPMRPAGFDEWGYGQITVQLRGSASLYLVRRQAFRNQAAKAKERA
jgi:hypothetical protein